MRGVGVYKPSSQVSPALSCRGAWAVDTLLAAQHTLQLWAGYMTVDYPYRIDFAAYRSQLKYGGA